MLIVALPKGRLANKVFKLLKELNICDITLDDEDRRLIVEAPNFKFFLAKPSDVPTFVDNGVCDIGVVGKDTLLEEDRDITELLDLGFGACRMCVCAKKEDNDAYLGYDHIRVASKYPNIAKEYFNSINKNVEIIKLNGSVELAAIVGLSDVIVDIVESGRTLKENGLVPVTTICNLTARLVANNASLKTKYEEISGIVSLFEDYLNKE